MAPVVQLGIISFGVLIITIFLFSGQKSSTDDVTDSPLEDLDEFERSVLNRFPGYFRTAEEQRNLENSLPPFRFSETLETANKDGDSENSRDSPWHSLTPSMVNYHSCCTSKKRYTSPSHVIDYMGIRRKLAVFGIYRQFFPLETCEQITGIECIWCTCRVEEVIYSGVYDTGDLMSRTRFGVTWFNADGCCKCYT